MSSVRRFVTESLEKKGLVGFVAGVASVSLVVGGSVAVAAIPSTSTGKITACVNKATAVTRIIDAQAGSRCKATEKTVTWAQKGPIGAAGTPGTPKATGTKEFDLKVSHCADVACTSVTTATLDWVAAVDTSVVVGTDGRALISYGEFSERDLKIAQCDNLACDSATTVALDTIGDVGNSSSIAVGTDGLGIVSYLDESGGALKVAH